MGIFKKSSFEQRYVSESYKMGQLSRRNVQVRAKWKSSATMGKSKEKQQNELRKIKQGHEVCYIFINSIVWFYLLWFLRYYYRTEILLPVPGKRLVYKFGPQATGWKTENPILWTVFILFILCIL